MPNIKFSVSWNIEKNLCDTLSSLQQNGQFVDMTLAAEGCFVKVHQLVIALASPYLKELVTSAQSPHPVIFLNQVSYNTLQNLLQYIYMGEAVVAPDELDQLIAAGKALRIKGIQDMIVEHSTRIQEDEEELIDTEELDTDMQEESKSHLHDIEATKDTSHEQYAEEKDADDCCKYTEDNTVVEDDFCMSETMMSQTVEEQLADLDEQEEGYILPDPKSKTGADLDIGPNVMQYTVSTQGSLQMILNRYVYYLKYTTQDNVRQWRCVDYVTKKKCPAYVIAKGNNVLRRVSAHQHPFHDKKILKKINASSLFAELLDAESQVKSKQSAKRKTRFVTVEVEDAQEVLEESTEQ